MERKCYICTECGSPCSLRTPDQDFDPLICPWDASIVPHWREVKGFDEQSFWAAFSRVRYLAEFAVPEYTEALDHLAADLVLKLSATKCVVDLEKHKERSIQLVADIKEIIEESGKDGIGH